MQCSLFSSVKQQFQEEAFIEFLGKAGDTTTTSKECSYSKDSKWPEKTIRIGKDVDPQHIDSDSRSKVLTAGSTQFRNIPVEHRGITLSQLLAIVENIKRRCIKEEWKRYIWKNGKPTQEYVILTPDTVNLHDINEYIIKPFTRFTGKSFVESLPSTAGWQSPRWFVSHSWNEEFYHTMQCLQEHQWDFSYNRSDQDDARGGGLTNHSPVWICAFANNQNDLGADIDDDPTQTGFAKAMKVAQYRVISILDVECKIFSRIWCILELHMTLQLPSLEQDRLNSSTPVNGNAKLKKKNRPGFNSPTRLPNHVNQSFWAIYTYVGTDVGRLGAVGIVSGGTPRDEGLAYITAKREIVFPIERIFNALNIDVKEAQASHNIDKIHILNSIAGRRRDELDLPPVKEHPKYISLNAEVKGAFAASIPALVGAFQKGRKDWLQMLEALKTGSSVRKMKFDFTKGYGWNVMLHCENDTTEMIKYLPPSIEELEIRAYPFGKNFIGAICDWILGSAPKLKSLSIVMRIHFDDEQGRSESHDAQVAGQKLAEIIGTNSNITNLKIQHTKLIGCLNINDWTTALSKNRTLTKLDIYETQSDDQNGCAHLSSAIRSATSATDIKVYFPYFESYPFPHNFPSTATTTTLPYDDKSKKERRMIRLFLVGSTVGKTCLVDRIAKDRFSDFAKATLGIDITFMSIQNKVETIKCQIWDTTGNKRSFKVSVLPFLSMANIIIFAYNVSEKESLLDTINRVAEVRNDPSYKACVECLLGLKIDRYDDREVTPEEGLKEAQKNGMLYYECSAKTGFNTNNLIPGLVKQEVLMMAELEQQQQCRSLHNEFGNEMGEKGKEDRDDQEHGISCCGLSCTYSVDLPFWHSMNRNNELHATTLE